MQEGAIRETKEEACADVKIGHLFASVDVVRVGQVHIFFTASLVSSFSVGEESLEVKLFNKNEIPWDELAFESGIFALNKYYEDQGINNGVHSLIIDRKRSKSD
jgi:ADP-ribose pyrophosphatase YjhB (NUDIX family)